MSQAPDFVTVIVPCLNEARFIGECLRDVLAQDYPQERIEILVADGGSVDGTRALLGDAAASHPRVHVIDNPDRLQAAGLNRAIRVSRGDVIVRMDVHCRYAPNYVRRCVEGLARTGADNVGGAQRALATTPFQKALCAALESPLGMGGARYRSAGNEGYVDTVFLGAFRRRVFETFGLYDPGAFTNEDAELNQRIVEGGGKIYLSRDVVVHYFPRESLPALARQYFRYGWGRARTLLKHRRLLALRSTLPFLLVLGALVMFGVPMLRPFAPWAIGAYVTLVVLEAIRVGRPAGLSAIARIAAIFPTLHFAHGLGFGCGLLRYLFRPDWGPAERLPPAPAT